MQKKPAIFLLMVLGTSIFQSPASIANPKPKQIAEYIKANKNFTEPPLDNYAITCGATHRCVALGTNKNKSLESYISSDDGSTWIHQSQHFLSVLPPFVNAVACDEIYENCVAVGKYCTDSNNVYCVPVSYFTSNGGVSWANSTFLYNNDAEGLDVVNCSNTGSHCIAAGYQNQVGVYDSTPLAIYSIDSGKSWMYPAVGPDVPPYTGESRWYRIVSQICDPTVTECTLSTLYLSTVVDFTTVDGGNNWQSPPFS